MRSKFQKRSLAPAVAVVIGGAVSYAIWHVIGEKFKLEYPGWIWGGVGVVFFMALGAWWKALNAAGFRVSGLRPDIIKPTSFGFLRHTPEALKAGGGFFICVVLAQPFSSDEYEDITREGIDIAMTMDLSASMLAMDFKPNRLESARKTALEFIQARANDRFALVLYEGESYTRVPLTTDHRVVLDAVNDMNTGDLEQGTAIGMGLATAVNRLKDSDGQSKVIILLTDGKNNRGSINPLDAAKMAAAFDIRVYTIGVGTKGKAKTPVALMPDGSFMFDWVEVDIDETLLKAVASTTGGKYFRATTESKLKDIYNEIDDLEKTKFNVSRYSQRTQAYFSFAMAALALFGIGFFMEWHILRTTP